VVCACGSSPIFSCERLRIGFRAFTMANCAGVCNTIPGLASRRHSEGSCTGLVIVSRYRGRLGITSYESFLSRVEDFQASTDLYFVRFGTRPRAELSLQMLE
jgi:hypothetical protein